GAKATVLVSQSAGLRLRLRDPGFEPVELLVEIDPHGSSSPAHYRPTRATHPALLVKRLSWRLRISALRDDTRRARDQRLRISALRDDSRPLAISSTAPLISSVVSALSRGAKRKRKA